MLTVDKVDDGEVMKECDEAFDTLGFSAVSIQLKK
jgi:hypothetical protein